MRRVEVEESVVLICIENRIEGRVEEIGRKRIGGESRF